MVAILARNWGLVALRGLVALIFGLLTLFNPAITLAALIFLFGGYAIADGVFTIIAAIINRRGEPHWIALILGGLAGIASRSSCPASPRSSCSISLRRGPS